MMDFDQSPTRRPRRLKDLPTFYYHEHFLEMLDFVVEHYDHVLAAGHRAIVREFRQLTQDEGTRPAVRQAGWTVANWSIRYRNDV